MSKERELLKKLLDSITELDDRQGLDPLTCEIEELLSQPEQEPYCWEVSNLFENNQYLFSKPRDEVYSEYRVIPLYTSPPKQEPLSDEEILYCFRISKKAIHAESFWIGVKFAEKAHGIGG